VVKNNVPYSDFSDFVGPGGKVIGGDEILGGQFESKGFEAELQIKASANFQIEMQYAYDDGKDTKDGPIDLGANLPGAIPESLTFLAKYHFSGGPLDGLEIGGGGRFTWGLTEYVLPSDVNFGSDNQPGPTRDLMAFIHYKMKVHGKPVELAVGGKNLTNGRLAHPVYAYRDVRTMKLSGELGRNGIGQVYAMTGIPNYPYNSSLQLKETIAAFTAAQTAIAR